jgi:phage N-6-adenine-methyltransferase
MSSTRHDWETPQLLFDALNAEFGFNLDVAASAENAKCRDFFTTETNGLAQDWAGHKCFCNPPYGREISAWVEKAYRESLKGTLVVMLIPARTDTSYWHRFIFGKAEVRFLQGRVRFCLDGERTGPAPFPSAVIVYRDGQGNQGNKCGRRGILGQPTEEDV